MAELSHSFGFQDQKHFGPQTFLTTQKFMFAVSISTQGRAGTGISGI